MYGWGNEIRLYANDILTYSTTDENADEYYYMLDI